MSRKKSPPAAKKRPAQPASPGGFDSLVSSIQVCPQIWQSVTANYIETVSLMALLPTSDASGILLCTRKNDALVEFALGDLSNKIFVSRYAVELPKKEEMERFLAQIGKEVAE